MRDFRRSCRRRYARWYLARRSLDEKLRAYGIVNGRWR